MAKTATAAGTGNQVVGKVFILYGTVKAVAPDGTVRVLAPNSPIYADERIITESDGSVSIQFDGPPVTQLDLGRMTEIVIDQDVYAGVAPEAVSEAAAEAEQVQQSLLEGDQPIELEATAAGGVTGAGGGITVFNLALDGGSVTPGSGADTTGITTTSVGTLSGVFEPAATPEPEPAPAAAPEPAPAVNNAPVISFEAGADAGAVQEDTTLEVSGQLTSTDIDPGATATWSIDGSAAGAYGSIMVDETGNWTYALNNDMDAVQSLAAGETLTETFTVQVSDGLGGVDTQEITITITGTNDQPILTAENTDGAMLEGDGAATLTDSGSLSFAELDATDVVTVSQTSNGDIVWSNGTLTDAQKADLVSGFTADQDSWDYTTSANLDFLAAGETITFSYDVVATDDSGAVDAASAATTVTITITGTNDQPTLTVEDTGAMLEGDGAATLTDSGSLSFADLDATDVVTVSQTSNNDITWDGGTLTDAQKADLVAGFTADQDSWDYTTSANLDFLAAGETITFSYDVVATDDSGAEDAASAATTVTITITGTNDQPILTVEDTAGAMLEGDGTATLTDSGSLSFADLDATDVVTVSQTSNNDITWEGGTLTDAQKADLVAGFTADQDSWDYTTSANLDFLAAGETITFSYDVVATDDSGAEDAASAATTVTITITGTNDAPMINAETTVASDDVSEGDSLAASTMTATGVVTFTDVDTTDTHSFSVIGDPAAHGTAVVDPTTGEWTYTVSDSGAVDALAADEHLPDSFTVQVDDGHGGLATQVVSIDIIGTNDAPIVAATDVTGEVTEPGDGTPEHLADSGTITFTDVDLTDMHHIETTITPSGGALGTLTATVTTDTTGTGAGGVITWNYSVEASAVAYLGDEDKIETFTLTLDDGHGGTVDRLIEVTIHGTNDLPTASITAAFVDDEGLSGGIPGGTGDIVVTPDTDSNEATFSGTLPYSFGGDGAGSIDFALMDGTNGMVGTEHVTYNWDDDTHTLTATVSVPEPVVSETLILQSISIVSDADEGRIGTELFTVQVDPTSGAYTVTLLENVLHDPPSPITINTDNYNFDTGISYDGMVKITTFVPGDTNPTLINNGNAFGIDSSVDGDAGYSHEINYLGADGSPTDTRSEVMSFELQGGKIATHATVDINLFYPNEGSVGNEVGSYQLFNDGVSVQGPTTFTANSADGTFMLDVIYAAGFDEIRFSALSGTDDSSDEHDGNGNDSSDYNVKQITFDQSYENNATAALTYTVTDSNGDLVDGTLNVTFNDDMPVAYDSENHTESETINTEGVTTTTSFDYDHGHVTGHGHDNHNVVHAPEDEWGISSKADVDKVTVGDDTFLQITDQGSGHHEATAVSTPAFEVAAGSDATISFDVNILEATKHTHDGETDHFTWTLYKLDDGRHWDSVKSETLTADAAVTHNWTEDTTDGGTYRLVFEANDVTGGHDKFTVQIDDIKVTHTTPDTYEDALTPVSGNLLVDSGDVSGDHVGSFGADGGHVLSIAGVGGGTADNTPESIDNVLTLTVTGKFGGTLTVDIDDGDYLYTPPEGLETSKTESFSFTVIDGDGDTASAQLDMLIDIPPQEE